MIGRRSVLAGLALAATPAALAQPKPRRIGVLRAGSRPVADDIQNAAIAAALRDLGYDVGRTLVIDQRYAEGRMERLPVLAQELIQDGAEAILAVGSSAVLTARDITRTVPIVMFANIDPVRLGVVDSLGRPNGNITGVLVAPDGSLAAKRLFLLKEAAPQARRFGLLAPGDDPTFAVQIAETEAAAAAAGVSLTIGPVRAENYNAAFAGLVQAGVEAVVIGSHTIFVRDRRAIIALAARHALPAIYEWPTHVQEGGLMSFGADLGERQQRVAAYLDRILKGAKPADLPFEQPAALRLVVNLKTARDLGLSLPAGLLARADEVVE
jgi:putative ABC transport system substrate-binding protein